jgi:DNA-binding XRE family transcriptional regulator
MLNISRGRGAATEKRDPSRVQIGTLTGLAAPSAPSLVIIDDLVGMTFRTMRHDLGVSQATLARRVGASVITIEALEAGAVRGLPGKSDLRRIIAAYAAMVHADLTPIEQRLFRYFEVPEQTNLISVRDQGHKPGTSKRPNRSTSKLGRVIGFLSLRRVLTLGIPLLTALGVATTAHTSPQSLFAVADTMPVSMRSFAQAGLAMITPVKSHRAEGLLWIDTADPRSRKADRLKTR